jgi:hypothetical protein
MPKKGQKTVTLSGESLKELEIYYEDELKTSFYKISFAQFITAHALRDIERGKK